MSLEQNGFLLAMSFELLNVTNIVKLAGNP